MPPSASLPRHKRPDRTIDDVRLTPRQRWGCFALLLAIFFFGGSGSVWENPFDIDRAVWFSYAPIPLLVAACLWWSGRLSLLTVFLNTVELAGLKFAATYSLSILLWAAYGAPPAVPRVTPVLSAPELRGLREAGEHHVGLSERPPMEAEPPATPWPASRRGTVRGSVLDASGAAVEGAVVYVASGLGDMVFARPEAPLAVEVGAAGFARPWYALHERQIIEARSKDQRLHTLLMSDGERVTRVSPLLPSGAPQWVHAPDVSGFITVRCNIHDHAAQLLRLHHPFHTASDAHGAFTLPDLPALPLAIRAWHPRQGAATTPLTPQPGQEATMTLRLDPPAGTSPSGKMKHGPNN